MKLKLSISPCPNDTFMFDALINGRIDTEGLEFEVSYKDIEELNLGTINGRPDISKISYAIVPRIYDRYAVLNSGSALGRGNGPLLVSNNSNAPAPDSKIAVPGMNTTARLLMAKFYPELKNITPVLFSEIAGRVASEEFDAGVLIHEGRFTYAEKGLKLICDLGNKWEQKTGMPLPLGAIAVSRSLPESVVKKADKILRKSIEYAFVNPQASAGFIREHAQEMSTDVIESHIELFVNEYSLNIGENGRHAVSELTGLETDKIFS